MAARGRSAGRPRRRTRSAAWAAGDSARRPRRGMRGNKKAREQRKTPASRRWSVWPAAVSARCMAAARRCPAGGLPGARPRGRHVRGPSPS